MTRNLPLSRMLMAISPALLVVAIAVGLAGGTHATGASAAVAPAAAPVIPAAAKVIPHCMTEDLTGTLFSQPVVPKSTVRDAVLRLTNTTDHPCQVEGWADITMVTPPGELVQVPTRKVTQPQGGAKITLSPRSNAWTRVEWDTCDAGHQGCQVGAALQYVIDPNSTGTVAETTGTQSAELTMKALRISPFQATRTAAALF